MTHGALPDDALAGARDTAAAHGWHAAVAAGVALLSLLYALVLATGLLTLPSPLQPIQDPWFTAMEVLILAIAPAMVALTVVIHARAAPSRKAFGAAAIAFMSMCAVVTCCVHFAILTLARQPAFAGPPWTDQVFAFRWPSVVYALDILAWDLFFALGALCAAAAIDGTGRLRRARGLVFTSGWLALAGLAGVPLADMQLRNIGIVGYVVAFPWAAAMLSRAYAHAATEADRPPHAGAARPR